MKQVKIYDISLPITSEMVVWPGDRRVSVEPTATIAKDGVALSHLSMDTHTGTHVDAPSHFLTNADTLDKIDLEKFIGECMVVDLTHVKNRQILPSDLEKYKIKKGTRILFKTTNSNLYKKNTFSSDYISLSLEGAEYLANKKIFLVGTDYLGIEKKSSPGHPVHKKLLQYKIVNLEGLNLSEVSAGKYQLVCLPLKVMGVDGSPARAVLMQ